MEIQEIFSSIKSGSNPIKIELKKKEKQKGDSWEIRACWQLLTVNPAIKSSAKNNSAKKCLEFKETNVNKNSSAATLGLQIAHWVLLLSICAVYCN